jgi:hypothetical protein
MPEPDTFKDGQADFLGGMDSSRTPDVIAKNAYALGVNINNRDSKMVTRNGFKQVNLSNGENDGLTKFQDGLFQGATTYRSPQINGETSLFASVSGWLLKINATSGVVNCINPTERNNTLNEKTYFCQAEKYLIIQDGTSKPLIYDGVGLTRATATQVPIGTLMAYGQGRLFVASQSRDYIVACDLVYGGSTTSSVISSSTAGASVSFTTATNHGFSSGDTVTIDGHSSEPTVNGTWTVTVTGATTFTIPRTTTVNGAGGRVVRANQGQVSDLLNVTETTYLSEGQYLQLPSQMGKIVGMIFQPVQATTAGQGDLIVFCEYGTCSFAVSQPRDIWKDTQFRRVTFDRIGATSERSIVSVNGDIFFYSNDAHLRTYRNAIAEFNSYGQVPAGSEMNRIWDSNSDTTKKFISACRFQNRLLMSAIGKNPPIAAGDLYPKPAVFDAMSVLDFNPVSGSSYKNRPVFDGIYTGLDVVQLVSDYFDGTERAFSFTFKNYTTNTLWEITNTDTQDSTTASSKDIRCILETRAYDFERPFEEKKIYKLETWWPEVYGDVTYTVYYRPDGYPCWILWGNGSMCSKVTTCAADANGAGAAECPNAFVSIPNLHPTYKTRQTLGRPDYQCNASNLNTTVTGYEFQLRIEWTGKARLEKILLTASNAITGVAHKC